MKKDPTTCILEFEVISPTNDLEKVGDKLTLDKFGEYLPANSKRGNNLLFLLDHTMHYRISKIMMRGTTYVIPADRKKNYITDVHPESLKFRRSPKRYDVVPDHGPVAAMCKSDTGMWIDYRDVKHLF